MVAKTTIYFCILILSQVNARKRPIQRRSDSSSSEGDACQKITASDTVNIPSGDSVLDEDAVLEYMDGKVLLGVLHITVPTGRLHYAMRQKITLIDSNGVFHRELSYYDSNGQCQNVNGTSSLIDGSDSIYEIKVDGFENSPNFMVEVHFSKCPLLYIVTMVCFDLTDEEQKTCSVGNTLFIVRTPLSDIQDQLFNFPFGVVADDIVSTVGVYIGMTEGLNSYFTFGENSCNGGP